MQVTLATTISQVIGSPIAALFLAMDGFLMYGEHLVEHEYLLMFDSVGYASNA